MTSSIGRIALGLGVVCSVLVSPLLAQTGSEPAQPETSFKKETFQWFEPVQPGGTLRVDNPFGAVYARFGGYEPQAEILATAQRIDQGMPPLEVRRTSSGSDLDVVVVVADDPDHPSASPEAKGPRDGRLDRIDLVVFVPQGVRLDVATDADRIEVKGIKGGLSARTVKGDIWVRSVHGPVSAESRRGHVAVTLSNEATEEAQKISTETGDIEVDLWEDAKFSVQVATSGQICTDWSIDIEYRRFEEPGKLGKVEVNGGGPALTLASKRGSIRLGRLPKHFSHNGPVDRDEPEDDD